MPEPQQSPQPQLADPLPALPLAAGAGFLLAGFAAVGLLFGSTWFFAPKGELTRAAVPEQFSDLSDGLITPVNPADRSAIVAAVAALRLPEAQRIQIEQEALAGKRALGWIVFTDSMDPDGDAIAVEAAGLVQPVALTKAWTAVAVPLAGTPIGVTAVRDGGGGGITVALATRSGPVTLRVLLPGERIEVAAP